MKIHKLRIENFKSIYDPLEIDFDNVKGFWKISGSVGSGKTSIGEAIVYGLFGSVGGKNQSDLISWGRKHGSVEIWCTSKNQSIYIKREMNSYGQSPIYVEVNGDELIFTNKRDAQMQLENEYYDISRVTVELLCIISFNNFKSLATLNSSDTKKFLDQVLGFSMLSDWADACKLFKSNNANHITTMNNKISECQTQVSKLEKLSNIERIEGDIEASKQEVAEFDQQLKALGEEHGNIINNKNSDRAKLIKQQASVLTLGKNKKKEIDFIEKGVCPTCGAPIDQSQLEIKKQERDVLLEQYNTITNDIAALDKDIKQINRQYEYDSVPIRYDRDQVKALIIRLEEQAKRRTINQNEIDCIKKEIDEYESRLSEYRKEDEQWKRLQDILSNKVRSSILQSFIPSLNQNILKYSQRLHLPYIVQFDQNFKCKITLCGPDKEIALSSLSTGQLKTVDMVIILGVLGTVIGTNGLNILFLDELFSNLDAGLRNEMCEVLKESMDKDTTIFIISHTDLENKHFDGDIHMKLVLKDQYEKHSVATIEKL